MFAMADPCVVASEKYALPTVGTTHWRNDTDKQVSVNHSLVERNDRNVDVGQRIDPLPNNREVYAELSNLNAIDYMREVRVVVNRLRETFLTVNENIKTTIRTRQLMEKELENLRKDIAVNEQSVRIRRTRPKRERATDGVDQILLAERRQLFGLKETAERHLKTLKEHLQDLADARDRLSNVLRERSRVLDLIPNGIKTELTANDISSASFLRQGLGLAPAECCTTGTAAQGGCIQSSPARPNTSNGVRPSTPSQNVGPLNAMTPEADQAIKDAVITMGRTASINCESNQAIKKSRALATEARQNLVTALERKMAETAAAAQRLRLSLASNRVSLNAGVRHYDKTALSLGRNQGPLNYTDLKSSELLDRPLIRVYQRHPGTQLPEAGQLRSDANHLNQSTYTTSRHISEMRLAAGALGDNLLDKRSALSIDDSVVKLRRSHADEKWVPGPVRAQSFYV